MTNRLEGVHCYKFSFENKDTVNKMFSKVGEEKGARMAIIATINSVLKAYNKLHFTQTYVDLVYKRAYTMADCILATPVMCGVSD